MMESLSNELSERPRADAPMELVRDGATIVRLENETQMTIAVQRPRDEAKILKDALHELDLYPSTASTAIYRKPVGKDPDTGEMKYAQGLSIRTAESLGSRWNNSSFGTAIVSEDEESAKIAAVFLDYERNTRTVVEQRVSKFYKTKKGGIQRYSPDRFDTVLKANASKLLREAILRRLPAGLKKEYELKARQKMKALPIENQREALVERFTELKVTVEMLETWRAGKKFDQWEKDDIIDALEVLNAIREDETSIEEVFGKPVDHGQQEEKKGPEPGLKVSQPESQEGAGQSLPLGSTIDKKPLERIKDLEKENPAIFKQALKEEQIAYPMTEPAALIVIRKYEEIKSRKKK